MLESLIPSVKLILAAIYSSFLGIIIYYTLVFSGQRWAANYNFMLTCFLLPLISFVITRSISTNIALSLGMVGALSIVRFRHPVKSPFELSIFFLLVTLGISINSSRSSSVVLIILFILIMFAHRFLNNNAGKITLIPTSFSGITNEEVYLLEILCTKPIQVVDSSQNLIFSDTNAKLSQYRYKLSFDSLDELNSVLGAVKESYDIDSAQIRKLS